ncbi:MAG: histidine kinase [Saprospiraceae bacterium]|nr:histidine kinase [Saprospiraceae bacterium]
MNFGIKDGMPEKYVYCATQDSMGYMWFGTVSGLYRYDGHNFKYFKSTINKPGRTIANVLQAVFCDQAGNLWLGSLNDLQWYNPQLNTFWSPDENIKEVLDVKNSNILHFSTDSKNQIWVSTMNNAFFKFNPKDSSFTHFKKIIPNKLSSATWRVFETSNGNYYSVHSHGLIHFNPDNYKFKHYPFPGNQISNAYYDKSLNKILLTTYEKGILAFNPETNTLDKYFFNNETLYKNHLLCLAKGPDDKIWIGSYPLFAIDLTQKDLKIFKPEINSEYSLKSSKICNLFIDRQQNIWICSYNGLSMLSRDNQQIYSLPLVLKTGGSFEPSGILEVPWTKELLIGNPGSGLFNIDRNSGESCLIANPLEAGNNAIKNLFKSNKGIVYAIDDKNLFRYLIHEKKLVPVSTLNIKDKFADRFVNNVVDDNNKVYFGYRSGGCYTLDLNNFKLSKIIKSEIDTSNVNNKDNTLIPCLKDSKGILWFTSNPGLYSYDSKLNRWTNYSSYPEFSNLNQAYSLEEDVYGHYWIVSLNGLYEFYFEDLKPVVKNYNQDSKVGLNDGYLYQIKKEPGTDKLWIASGKGLIRFDPRMKKVLTILGQQHGFSDIIYEFIITDDRKLCQFDIGVLNILDLNSYKFNNYIQPVQISSFKIEDKEISLQDIFSNEPYHIEYSKNFLSFEFSSLNMSNSNQVKYTYLLEGNDKEWSEPHNRNYISFSGLKPSKYVLHLKAINNSGIESSSITKFPFIITPPFWNTWWFRSLFLTFLGGIVIFFLRFRIQNIKQEEKQKQEFQKKIGDVEMKALRAQMNPHFIFNSLNSVQKYILKKDHHTAAQYLTKFARLMRLILDHSDQNYIMISSELELLRLYIEMESLRFDQAFVCHFEIDPKLNAEVSEIPSMLVQPYVENAIWHGLLHKEEPGNLYLKFLLKSEDLLEVVIEDDGIGRTKATELKSKQVLKKKSYGMQITGSRIAILNRIHQIETKIIIEDLVKDNKPSGTRITITIPIKTSMS